MYGILVEKPQEKGPVADLGRDVVITLRRILSKEDI
jgi:hypothetical protein